MTENDVRKFADALSANSTLMSLDLSINQLDSKVGDALGGALLKNTGLVFLKLNLNQLRSDGMTKIANALL